LEEIRESETLCDDIKRIKIITCDMTQLVLSARNKNIDMTLPLKTDIIFHIMYHPIMLQLQRPKNERRERLFEWMNHRQKFFVRKRGCEEC
jgi:hypothetical protein